jgi:hypothetical protein
LMYAFAPEKTPSLAGRNFCLAMALEKVSPAALRRRHNSPELLKQKPCGRRPAHVRNRSHQHPENRSF